MNTTHSTSKEYFRSNKIVFFALIQGIVFFGAIAFYLVKTQGAFIGEAWRDKLLYIVPAFVLLGYLGSNVIFKSLLRSARGKSGLAEKMIKYRSALIVRYAFLEGPSFFAIISYVLDGHIIFLGFAGLLAAYMLSMMPTISRAETELDLMPGERTQINNPGAIIT